MIGKLAGVALMVAALGILGCGASVKELGPVEESPEMTPDAKAEMMKTMREGYKARGIKPPKDLGNPESGKK